MSQSPLPDRLEMLLVAEWLEAGTPSDGLVHLRVADAARELGCDDDRAGLLEIMGALGALEELRVIEIEWAGAPGSPAIIRLGPDLRRDARRALEPPPGYGS
jgi:hypothetical protein